MHSIYHGELSKGAKAAAYVQHVGAARYTAALVLREDRKKNGT